MNRDQVFRKTFLLVLACTWFFMGNISAQKNYTKSGVIIFYSKAPLENITAVNKSVTAVLDTKTGTIQAAVQMKGFEFEKALMQEHFNENYVESDKYPKATFTGRMINNDKIIYTKDGEYPAMVKGKLMFHGVTREIEASGKIIVIKGIPQMMADFNLTLEDYKISIPSLVADKVSKNVKLTIVFALNNVLK